MKIKTWDTHSINDEKYYKATFTDGAYSAAAVSAVMVERVGRYPKFGAVRRPEKTLEFDVHILDGSQVDALAVQLLGWFDPDDETPKKLIVEDDATGNDRYVMAVCEAMDNAGSLRRRVYHATLKIDGDPLWQSESSATDTWDITASGQTKSLTNGGEAPAYPILSLKPTGAKTGGYTYKRYIPIRWRTNEAAVMYPVDVFDNNLDGATLIGAGKMQADGDDVRVRVNGLEVSRWLQDINTATSQCWVSLDFQAKQEVLLSVDCASAGDIDTISAASDISGFPVSGTVMIDSEAFVYTGKDDGTNQFTGVTRSANGTTAAAHDTTDTIWWVQHDIWVTYGDAAATTPVYTNTGKPMMSLASLNTSWVYADFGVDGETRAGAWTAVMNGTQQSRTNQATNSSATWAELGIACIRYGTKSGYIYLMNPCYITNANFTNGEYKVNTGAQTYFNPSIDEYHPGTVLGWDVANGLGITPDLDAWTAWTKNQAISGNATGVRLWHSSYQPDPWVTVDHYIEAADVTLTLNSSYTPAITIGDEASVYALDCTIKNNTTGESIAIDFAMSLDQYLEIDTNAKTVTYLLDGSSQYQALTLVGGLRRDWLKLEVGVNEIEYTEASATAMTIDWSWRERSYQ